MEETKTEEAATEVVMTTTEEAKPKRKRAPRKPRAAAEAAPKEPRSKKLPNEVKQEGKNILLTGKEVKLAKLTPKQRANFGIKEIDGKMGVPCVEPVMLTFKSEKAAITFFENCFTDEDGTHDFIDTGNRTQWLSDHLSDMVS